MAKSLVRAEADIGPGGKGSDILVETRVTGHWRERFRFESSGRIPLDFICY